MHVHRHKYIGGWPAGGVGGRVADYVPEVTGSIPGLACLIGIAEGS